MSAWRTLFKALPIVAGIGIATVGFAIMPASNLSGTDDISPSMPFRVTAAQAAPDAKPAENKPAQSESNDAAALWSPVAAVLRHPRCMNCHPRDDRPRQGDDRHPHLQNVVRGEDGLGFVNARCTACHRDENNDYSGVPGAPNWHLAPLSMGWNGLNDADLCTTLKDQSKNGGKDIAALVEHMEQDKLVLWGWEPGGDRAPVTPPHPQFVSELKAWAAAGAPCPVASK